MRNYNYGVPSLKANSSSNNTYGKVHISTNTSKTNTSQYAKLKNKAYFKVSKKKLTNGSKSKQF